jgi:hypothetical protein
MASKDPPEPKKSFSDMLKSVGESFSDTLFSVYFMVRGSFWKMNKTGELEKRGVELHREADDKTPVIASLGNGTTNEEMTDALKKMAGDAFSGEVAKIGFKREEHNIRWTVTTKTNEFWGLFYSHAEQGVRLFKHEGGNWGHKGLFQAKMGVKGTVAVLAQPDAETTQMHKQADDMLKKAVGLYLKANSMEYAGRACDEVRDQQVREECLNKLKTAENKAGLKLKRMKLKTTWEAEQRREEAKKVAGNLRAAGKSIKANRVLKKAGKQILPVSSFIAKEVFEVIDDPELREKLMKKVEAAQKPKDRTRR